MEDGHSQVSIFWDASAKPKSTLDGFTVVQSIRAFARQLGTLKNLRFYVDVRGGVEGFSTSLASELQSSGVSVIDTVSSGRAGASTKMLLADLLVHGMDNPPSTRSTAVVITADPDVAYAISLLRARGRRVVLLCPSSANSNLINLAGGRNGECDVFDPPGGDFASRDFGNPLGDPGPNGYPFLGTQGTKKKGKGRQDGSPWDELDTLPDDGSGGKSATAQQVSSDNDCKRCAQLDLPYPQSGPIWQGRHRSSVNDGGHAPSTASEPSPSSKPYKPTESISAPDVPICGEALRSPSSETQFSFASSWPPAAPSFSSVPTTVFVDAAEDDPSDPSGVDKQASLDVHHTSGVRNFLMTLGVPPPPMPTNPTWSHRTHLSDASTAKPPQSTFNADAAVLPAPTPTIPALPQGEKFTFSWPVGVPSVSPTPGSTCALLGEPATPFTVATIPAHFVPLVEYLNARMTGPGESAIYPAGLMKGLLSRYPGLLLAAGVQTHINPAYSYLSEARRLGLIEDSFVNGAVYLSPGVATQVKAQKTALPMQSDIESNVGSLTLPSHETGTVDSLIPRHFDALIEVLNEKRATAAPGEKPPTRASLKNPLAAKQSDVFQRAGVATAKQPIKPYVAQAKNFGIVTLDGCRVSLDPKYYNWKRR